MHHARRICYVCNRCLFSLSPKNWKWPKNLTRIFCHQASQQTNFGRVHDQPGFPAPDARLIWKILDVCISPHLPRFQVIEIEALSILKNFYHQSGIDVEEKILFRVESHVFAGEEFESKWRLYKFLWLKPICFSEYLKHILHILELWNALNPFTRASARKPEFWWTSIISFACMNDPESKQIYTQTNYFCTYSSWGYGLNKT